MKKWIAVLVIIVVGTFLWFFLSNYKTARPSVSPEKIAAENAAVSNGLAKQNANTVATIESNFARVQSAQGNSSSSAVSISTAPAGPPSPLQFTNLQPIIVVENMSRAIHQYGEMFGGNPVGTNPEFTSQLSGNNPKHINFINPDAGMRINDKGELIDPWGTPYFFHQLSGSDTEVRSAGPDRKMWTSDDIVTQSE